MLLTNSCHHQPITNLPHCQAASSGSTLLQQEMFYNLGVLAPLYDTHPEFGVDEQVLPASDLNHNVKTTFEAILLWIVCHLNMTCFTEDKRDKRYRSLKYTMVDTGNPPTFGIFQTTEFSDKLYRVH